MSKAFTSEDAPDDPLLVRPRAPLPPGTPNHVTPRGLRLLQRERASLAEALAEARAELGDPLSGDASADARRKSLLLAARLAELDARVVSAVVTDPDSVSQGVVRLGATVTVTDGEGEEARYRIVGVDEANPGAGLVAFTAPLAKALLGREVGDTPKVRTPKGLETLEIAAIAYESDEEVERALEAAAARPERAPRTPEAEVTAGRATHARPKPAPRPRGSDDGAASGKRAPGRILETKKRAKASPGSAAPKRAPSKSAASKSAASKSAASKSAASKSAASKSAASKSAASKGVNAGPRASAKVDPGKATRKAGPPGKPARPAASPRPRAR